MQPQFRFLSLPTKTWSKLNQELSRILIPVSQNIYQNRIPLSNSCSALWATTKTFLLSKDYVREQVFAPAPQPHQKHKSKVLLRVAALKNAMRQHRNRDREQLQQFQAAVRAHNVLLNRQKAESEARRAAAAEKSFKSDPFKYSKRLLREQSKQQAPLFDQQAAEQFMLANYAQP